MSDLTAQVDSLRKQLDLMNDQFTKLEEHVVKAEEESTLLKQDMPKRLEESIAKAVEKYQQSDAFDSFTYVFT